MQIFRSIRESEIEVIAALEQEIFQDAWTKQGILDTYNQSQAFITVAEIDGEIVGYCIVYYVMDEAEIARIAVNFNYRRQGVGRDLLDFTKRICLEKGVSRLMLDVRESNNAARKFYENYGFQEDGIRKNFYDMPKEHAVLMSMLISD